jgi:cell wall-associated NlpC family hydrolase
MAAPALAVDLPVTTTDPVTATVVADGSAPAVPAAVPAAAAAVPAVETTTSFRVAPAARVAAPLAVAAAPAAAPAAATSMRLSTGALAADGTSRIGVRLLSGSSALTGQPVTVQAETSTGWVEVRRLRTDGAGLAVGQVPFTGRTAVRAVFEGTATHAGSTSPTGTVQPRVVAQARPAPSVGALAVQLASQQAGKPYRYGSTGPSAFDCSGFTSYIYGTRLGKKLPRTSAAQAAALPKVAPAAKQPGDLLFFRTRGRVSHVGIYAGGGKMWAAPTSGDRVKLQSIYSKSYSVGRVV